jgi:hypothetical protein
VPYLKTQDARPFPISPRQTELEGKRSHRLLRKAKTDFSQMRVLQVLPIQYECIAGRGVAKRLFQKKKAMED